MNTSRCPHCRNPFRPEPHNAWHQRYCTRRACQRARNRASYRAWRRKNPGFFRKYMERVRAWRESHPFYWRRDRRKAFSMDVLLPVCRAGRNTVGVRITDLEGFTIQHVVLASGRGWAGGWRDVGLTLQNVVPPLAAARLSFAS